MVLNQLLETPGKTLTVLVRTSHTLLLQSLPWAAILVSPEGWETQHSTLVVPTMGKSHRDGGYLTPQIVATISPTLLLSQSGPHFVFLNAQLIIRLTPISIILLPFRSALPPLAKSSCVRSSSLFP